MVCCIRHQFTIARFGWIVYTAFAMSDNQEESVVTEEATTLAESEAPQLQQQEQSDIIKKTEKMHISLSIWPPKQSTRDAVISRLVETLSAPSILSNRYGCMPAEEAASAARIIEEEAFSTAAALSTASNAAQDDGIEILQVYSKEISKKMLEAVKSKAPAASPNENPSQTPIAAPATSDEISSVKIESS
ncbi:PREDICTED: MFP1 attachment factor 1-like [Nelumbo nucifera]|uniref:MFP1 attachment factor 1-like n=2 Tax=Nelumbo nucifera TaxID=4432 RepID=A0A1U8B655_NELNU|nr:PREDICTED: MFP1 attachment factor 1-like [Nelumbo nucifera]DAD41385.1 TPA_asm: hypothetical protein HUJ06_015708 [Nelumbo nucifera]